MTHSRPIFYTTVLPRCAPAGGLFWSTTFAIFESMSEIEVQQMEEKILRGIELAYQKLVEQKKRENGELVFSQDGKIVVVKACDLD